MNTGLYGGNMANKTQKAKDLQGINIYQTGIQTVYYDAFTKKGYVILNDDVKKYIMFQMAYPLIIAGTVYLSTIVSDPWISIIAGIGGLLIAYILFRLLFLGNLAVAERFVKPQRDGLFTRIFNQSSRETTVTQMIIAGLVAYLLYAEIQSSSVEGFYLYFYYACTGIAFILCILHGAALIRSFLKK